MGLNKELKSVKAYWNLNLHYECPHCENHIDYLDTDEYNYNDGGGKLPNPLESAEMKITCDCGEEIILDVQGGL